MNQHKLKALLHEILSNKPSSIQAKVAQEALERDNPVDFFNEITQYGCVSGMVSGLIYYCDTHRFFDDHYEEILELKAQYEDETGSTLKIEGDLKNYLAWFAFEISASNLANQIEMD
jgi:hypothetical protein